jgi:hypothetical protein
MPSVFGYTASFDMGLLRRPFVANLGLALLSTALGLAAIEAVARVAHYRRGGGKEADERSRYIEPDPRLGWRKIPGARVMYTRREYTVEVAVNRLGLRGPETTYETPPGNFRMLALGDSFIEGYSVGLDETVTRALERRVTSSGCPVEVLNGGTAGYSTDQEYLFYAHEGSRYDPRVVMLFFFYNDLLSNTTPRYFAAPKPLLVASGDGVVHANYPVPRPGPRRDTGAAPVTRDPIQGSAAFHWAADRLARGAPRAYNRLARFGLWDPLGGDEIDEQLRVYKRRKQPNVEAAWELTDRILRTLARDVASHGARFLVVYIPSRMEVSDRDWELSVLRFNLDETVWDRGLVAARLKEIGEAAGFPVLDLTAALRKADRGMLGGPYFLFDGHWNALGHTAAAIAVEEFLREQKWLPGCVPPSGR